MTAGLHPTCPGTVAGAEPHTVLAVVILAS
jgi:hypothetical protein